MAHSLRSLQLVGLGLYELVCSNVCWTDSADHTLQCVQRGRNSVCTLQQPGQDHRTSVAAVNRMIKRVAKLY